MMSMKYKQVVQNLTEQWPKGRSGHRMCADENFLYVYGGYNPADDNKTYNELWRYNTSTSRWIKLPDDELLAPTSCASSSMVLCRNNIFIFGGTGYPFASTNSNDLFMYSLKFHKWIDLNKCNIPISSEDTIKTKECGCTKIYNSQPIPKYGQSMTISASNKLFVFSGTTGQDFSKELHAFCLTKLRWSEYKLCDQHDKYRPNERYRHESISLENQFYVLGGATLYEYFEFSNLQSFSYFDKAWKNIQCISKVYNNEKSMVFPEPRKAHSCVSYDGNIYMVGGMRDNREVLDDVWKYNIVNKTWEKFEEKFPYTVLFHSAAVTTFGCMYVFGGVTACNNTRVANLHQVWLKVPSLKRQAWMKIVEMLKLNKQLNTETLTLLGIPKYFMYLIDDSGGVVAA